LATSDERLALAFIARNSSEPIPYERALLRSAALNWLVRTAPILTPDRVTVDALVRMLRRVPAGLRKWTWEGTPRTPANPARRWHIDHEYHVRNFLWMVLSPIFPDLDDEPRRSRHGPPDRQDVAADRDCSSTFLTDGPGSQDLFEKSRRSGRSRFK